MGRGNALERLDGTVRALRPGGRYSLNTAGTADTQLLVILEDMRLALDTIKLSVSASGNVRLTETEAATFSEQSDHEESALTAAKQILAVRRSREKMFGTDLFSDPVWYILLELFVAHLEREDVTVGNACLAASVPTTSALRWCQELQERGLVYRERDPCDQRRIFLRMSEGVYAQFVKLLAPIPPNQEQNPRQWS